MDAAAKTRELKAEPEKAASFVNELEVDYGGLPNRDLKKNLGGCG